MLGLVGFLIFESSSRLAPQPTMPLHLLSNRTSATVFFLTFLHSIITIWSLYFLPVYFQGVLGSTSSRSGVQLLPTILALVPFAAIGGTLLTKFGRYRPIHHAGFALVTIGFGLFTLLDRTSNTGTWVGFQLIQAAGAGLGKSFRNLFPFFSFSNALPLSFFNSGNQPLLIRFLLQSFPRCCQQF